MTSFGKLTRVVISTLGQHGPKLALQLYNPLLMCVNLLFQRSQPNKDLCGSTDRIPISVSLLSQSLQGNAPMLGL